MKVWHLFYLLIIFIYFGEIGKFEIYTGVKVGLADIILSFTLIISLIILIKNKRILNVSGDLSFPISIFAALCLLSLLFNIHKLNHLELIISAFYFIRWLIYAGVYYFVIYLENDKKISILKTLLFSQIIFISFGFIQYLYYPNLRNLFYLGWDDHLFRLFSTFLDPNFTAAQINLFIFLLFGLFFAKNIFGTNHKIILSAMIFVSFVALLLTYSRSGYLMFISGSIINLWLLNKKKFIGIMLSLLIVGIIIIPKNLDSSGVQLWRTASINARFESVYRVSKVIKENPILGVGFNALRYAQRDYGYLESNSWMYSHSGAGTDNSFLFVFATTGILGLIAYIYLKLTIIKISFNSYSVKGSSELQKVLSIVILSSIGGLFINSLFINSLFYPPIMFWMWTIIGLAYSNA